MKAKLITKKRQMLTLFVLAIFLVLPACLMAENLSAREVMQKVEHRDDGETSITDMAMILIDNKGNKRVRQLKTFGKDYGEDSKSISFFQSPADVRNTAFLAYDWDDEKKEDDNWLFLPALRKVKRISSGNKKDAFMGSDFSYADMNGIELSEWNFKFLKENVIVGGYDCWVIAAVPKKGKRNKVIKETGYVKSITWIRKDIFIPVKSKMYIKKGKKIKYFTASDIEKIQGIWTVKKSSMVTTRRKKKEHATVMIIKNIQYNDGVDDSMFTTQQMERGL